MKKNVWAKVLSLAVALVCVLGLAACGGNGGTSKAAGTYRLQTLDMGGLSMDVAQLAETAGISEDEIKIVLDLKSDGSFTLDAAALEDNLSMEGTWEENGSEIKLTAEGQTTTATLADGVITFAEEGVTMTFKK